MKRLINVILTLCLLSAFLVGCTGAENPEAADGVDVDFTTLNSVMAEGVFRNITSNSEDYLGKTIRASGELINLFIDAYDRYYRYVAITEGDDICCPPDVFEIRLTGAHVVDDDYPESGTIIEVTGILSRFDEFGTGFLYLAVDEIIIVSA